MFAGAAAYIGTLWATEQRAAYEFSEKLNENIFDKSLADSFFAARDILPNEVDRMNYVMTGSFENKYDSGVPFTSDGLRELKIRIMRLIGVVRNRLKSFNSDTPPDIRNNTEIDEWWLGQLRSEIKESENNPNG